MKSFLTTDPVFLWTNIHLSIAPQSLSLKKKNNLETLFNLKFFLEHQLPLGWPRQGSFCFRTLSWVMSQQFSDWGCHGALNPHCVLSSLFFLGPPAKSDHFPGRQQDGKWMGTQVATPARVSRHPQHADGAHAALGYDQQNTSFLKGSRNSRAPGDTSQTLSSTRVWDHCSVLGCVTHYESPNSLFHNLQSVPQDSKGMRGNSAEEASPWTIGDHILLS